MLLIAVILFASGCTAKSKIEKEEINDKTVNVEISNLVIEEIDIEDIKLLDDEISFKTMQYDLNFDNASFNLNQAWDKNDLELLSIDELAFLRNSVYAKHGYVFKNETLARHFSEYDWYAEGGFDLNNLTEMDQKNIKLVQNYEKMLTMNYQIANPVEMYDDVCVSVDDLKVSSMALEIEESVNKPRRVIISSPNNQIEYDSLWNDGLYAAIVDFDKSDEFIDIYIMDSGTDIGVFTVIYRYDGNEITEYGSFDHFSGNFLYDENGFIYYWYGESDMNHYNYYYDYKLKESFKIEEIQLMDTLNNKELRINSDGGY